MSEDIGINTKPTSPGWDKEEKEVNDLIQKYVQEFGQVEQGSQVGRLIAKVETLVPERVWCEVRDGKKYFVFMEQEDRQVVYPADPYLQLMEDLYLYPVPKSERHTKVYE